MNRKLYWALAGTALATGWAADSATCMAPVGSPPAGRGKDFWKGLYAYAESCTSNVEGQCIRVPQEMFDGEFVNRVLASVVTPPPVLTISLTSSPSKGNWTFSRVLGSPAAGVRLVWIKFVPGAQNQQPVLARHGACGDILFIEPAPGG